jgi:hypothetical protein
MNPYRYGYTENGVLKLDTIDKIIKWRINEYNKLFALVCLELKIWVR